MAEFAFDVPPSMAGWLAACGWEQSHLCGIEGVPLPTRVRVDGTTLTLVRSTPGSAKLVFPATIDGLGPRTLTTTSLRPTAGGVDGRRHPPYGLIPELARGAVDAMRRHGGRGADGESMPDEPGISPESGFVATQLAHGRGDTETAARHGVATIVAAHRRLAAVTRRRWTETINATVASGRPLGTLVAVGVTPPRRSGAGGTMTGGTKTSGTKTGGGDAIDWTRLASAFNAVNLRTTWSDLESDSGRLDFDALDHAMDAASAAGLRVVAGPLLDFRGKRLPHWLYLLEDDFDSLVRVVCRMATSVVSRYAGRVQLWNVASALNLPGPLPLSEERTMALAVKLLQSVRRADPNAATLMSFDCPMGEYLASNARGISPIHFADAVLRSGLGLSGLGLEIRTGYDAPSTLPRGAWEFGSLMDRWSMLGVPLMVTAAVPADVGPDHHAISERGVVNPRRDPDMTAADRITATPASQLTDGGSLLAAALARSSVHGFVWDGYDDRLPHTVPHAGLIDAAGRSRPLWDVFRRLRSGVV